MTDLPIAELLRRSRFHQVVDAGAAAADVGVRERQQLDARDRSQQIPRLLPNALRVREVTRIVIRHAHRRRLPCCHRRTQFRHELTDIAHPGGERARPLRPLRVAGQQLPVLFHRRAASGRVHRNHVDAGALERRDGRSCEALRLVYPAGMQRQRAAAPLLARGHDVAALGRQDVHAGRVDVREDEALDAPGQQPDRHPARGGRRRPFRHASGQRFPGHTRREREHGAYARC